MNETQEIWGVFLRAIGMANGFQKGKERNFFLFYNKSPAAVCRVEETRDHWGLSQPSKYNEMPE